MSLVDTSKARAYAEMLRGGGILMAADWILELADEVESLEHTLHDLRIERSGLLVDAARLQAERDAAVARLREVHASIAEMLRETHHLADNHPDPVVAGTALRILGKGPS